MSKMNRFIQFLFYAILALAFLPKSAAGTNHPRELISNESVHTASAQQLQAMDNWLEHRQLVVHNIASTVLPADYTVSYVLDTATLIAANQMLETCDDLRITFDDGTGELELDRLVEGCNTATTAVSFRTRSFIALGASDARYHLYYDNPAAGPPPADHNQVLFFYEDFQNGAERWNPAKGSWSVAEEGSNSFYRYTGGGANWAISYVPLAGIADLDYIARVRADSSTNWIGLAFRIQDPDNFLTFYQSKDVGQFKFARVVGDNHYVPSNPGFTMPADTWHYLRLQAVGSQVRARIWPAGSPEPTGWNIQYTETTFQSQTNIGATLYYHVTNADWDDILVRKLVDIEPTVELYEPEPPITAWYYRLPVTVTNTSGSETLSAGYAVQIMLDTAALIADGKMLSTCDDLRLGSLTGGQVFEIHRVVENCGSASTRVWFAIERPLAPAATDGGYYAYYGDPAPAQPLADEMQVFLFYEDWEKGTNHWTAAGGLDPANSGTMGTSLITTDDWVSPAHSQIFPEKRGGGDAFSGFIPVTPDTTYAISAWAKSAANTYAPVGFDPYTADYVKGPEVWLWTNEWTINPTWSWRSAQFTTAASTAYIKIKSEWWDEAPGDQPVYMDNLAIRPAVASEPLLALGDEETTLAVPVIAAIVDDGPVELGQTVTISAAVSTTEGSITAVTLRLISPIALDVPMALSAGTNADGTWAASYLPTQGGEFSYRIRATSSQNYSSLSPLHTFAVIDETPPEIGGLTFSDPLFVKDTQTVTATVTDNGALSSVTLTVAGATHPMTSVGDLYSFSWQVNNVGAIPFTITALDTAGNQAQLGDSFTSQPREVDVCTWRDCKVGAQSWSNDDGNTACKDNLEAAGFRGTYYYNGASTLSWFAQYSADGHEVASHTVGHPCNPPSCFPNCTPESLMECPYTEADVIAYRGNQLEPNIAAIEAGSGVPVLSLAWPCGTTDPGRMEAASYYYLGARGYYDHIALLYWIEDVNLPVPDNLYNLNSAASYRQDFIDRAYTEGKWAIITSHGSCAGIDYMGTRTDVLWSAPVGEVLKYIYVRENTEFSEYLREGRTISFTAAHTLDPFLRPKLDGTFFDPILFDNPVSLKVHIFETDTVLSVLVDGIPVPFTVQTLENTRYVVFDAALHEPRDVTVNLSAPAPAIELVTDNSPAELGQTAQVTAVVTVSDGTLTEVTLRVLTPEPVDYSMLPVDGTPDSYAADFPAASLVGYTYQVLASNDSGGSSQSAVRTLLVQDTFSPVWQSQSQTQDSIAVGDANTLSAEGFDIGGLQWAILETNETGEWQQFTWPISDWWDHNWAYRVPVTLTESAGLARAAETVDVLMTASEFPGLQDCAAELRVADTERNELPIQVYGEVGSGETLSCHLLFQADLEANSSRIYYIYYGNPTAAPPAYTTDLSSSTTGGLLTVQNNFFDLDLNLDAGIVSRLRLRQGSDTNLPLSPQSDIYWGWHQVCSSLDGNITGKNSLCQGGTSPATGLSLEVTLDGPVVKEYTFTSLKGAASYTIAYRFYASSPFYGYQLARAGTAASVMNNFWYANGNFASLGAGTGSPPAEAYNTYDFEADHVLFASFTAIDVDLVDGQNNDGTNLGGTEYTTPTASGLELWVTTGDNQGSAQAELERLAAPLGAVLGAVQTAPETQYGSPANLYGSVEWAPVAFLWQNPAIPVGTEVQWRVKFCDVSGNCASTSEMTFSVVQPTVVRLLHLGTYSRITGWVHGVFTVLLLVCVITLFRPVRLLLRTNLFRLK